MKIKGRRKEAAQRAHQQTYIQIQLVDYLFQRSPANCLVGGVSEDNKPKGPPERGTNRNGGSMGIRF